MAMFFRARLFGRSFLFGAKSFFRKRKSSLISGRMTSFTVSSSLVSFIFCVASLAILIFFFVLTRNLWILMFLLCSISRASLDVTIFEA